MYLHNPIFTQMHLNLFCPFVDQRGIRQNVWVQIPVRKLATGTGPFVSVPPVSLSWSEGAHLTTWLEAWHLPQLLRDLNLIS